MQSFQSNNLVAGTNLKHESLNGQRKLGRLRNTHFAELWEVEVHERHLMPVLSVQFVDEVLGNVGHFRPVQVLEKHVDIKEWTFKHVQQ